MKAYRVSLRGAQNRKHSGSPWALWRKEFCLAACLAERHVKGRKQGTTARHRTRVIVGHRLFFCRRHLRSAFGAKRILSARQNRLSWSKMTQSVHCRAEESSALRDLTHPQAGKCLSHNRNMNSTESVAATRGASRLRAFILAQMFGEA